MRKAVKLIIAILVLALLVGGVWFIIKRTGLAKNISDSVGDFRVEYNGQTYKGGDNRLLLPASGEVRFEVKGFNASPYTVKVEPGVDFEYEVGGRTFHFADCRLTDYFVSAENIFNGNFVIDCDVNYAPGAVLERIWGEAVTAVYPDSYPYTLVVTSAAGDRVSISFGQAFLGHVEVVPDHIVM